MSIQFSALIQTRSHGEGAFSVQSLALSADTSPVELFDDFRVSGQPFAPHPHAGFAAVTYVLRDSQGGLRSRDSLGGDHVVGPGGIVWSQASSGMLHEEVPAERGQELHGLQIFVNLTAKHKLTPARVFKLDGQNVPIWQRGDEKVRVVVGSHDEMQSPLVPAEPFDLLDINVHRELDYALRLDHRAIVYVRSGSVVVHADAQERVVPAGRAIVLAGGGAVTLATTQPANVILLSGAAIREPKVAHGPFIMNDRAQLEAAIARHRSGAMGHLAPLSRP